jgi:hypothetical protein
MIEMGQLHDPNYVLDEKGKARYLFDKKTEDGVVEKIFRKHSKHGSISVNDAHSLNKSPTRKRKPTSSSRHREDSDDDDDPTFSMKKSTSKKKSTPKKNTLASASRRVTRQSLQHQEGDDDNESSDDKEYQTDHVVPN